MRYPGRLLFIAVLVLTVSGAIGARAGSTTTCPVDARRFDYSGLVLCWPSKDETIDISLYESLGLTVSEKWIGSAPVSGQAFDIASEGNRKWPPEGTSVNVDFVPFGHWKASLGGSSQLTDILGRILLQQVDFTTVDSFTVRTEDDGTLAFTRISDDVFGASRQVPFFESPRGRLEYRARISGDFVDYVMRCLVEEEPRWWPVGCRAIWLTDRYVMVGTMTSDKVDAAMMVYAQMRQKILSHLIKPKLTVP